MKEIRRNDGEKAFGKIFLTKYCMGRYTSQVSLITG